MKDLERFRRLQRQLREIGEDLEGSLNSKDSDRFGQCQRHPNRFGDRVRDRFTIKFKIRTESETSQQVQKDSQIFTD